jgi:DNA-binding protein H-NS
MANKQLRTMDTNELIAMRGKIDAELASRRKDLESQLASLSGGDDPFPLRKKNGLASATLKTGRKGKRGKAKPKYQSKKKKSLKWSGRGLMPVWMREEMKGTKLKKENFLIK